MKMLKSVLCVVAAGFLLVQGLFAAPESVAKEHAPFMGKWEGDFKGAHYELWIEENGQCVLMEDGRSWNAIWRTEGSKVFINIKPGNETFTAWYVEPNMLMVQEGSDDPTPFRRSQPEPLSQYNKMDKQQLQEAVKQLQKAVLITERVAREAGKQMDETRKAYKSAPNDEKPELLLLMIEVEKKARKQVGDYKLVRADLEAAKRVLLNFKSTPHVGPVTMPAVLLEQGIYTEETVGDLDRAIEIYKQIVDDDQANRKVVAEALFRMGRCHAASGQNQAALEKLQKLTKQFPEQGKLVDRASELTEQILPALWAPFSVRTDVTPASFKGVWIGQTTDKPEEGSSTDTITLHILEPSETDWKGSVSGSFARDGKQEITNIRFVDQRITFRTKARDGDAIVWLGLHPSQDSTLIGESFALEKGDGRKISMGKAPHMLANVTPMHFVGTWKGELFSEGAKKAGASAMIIHIKENGEYVTTVEKSDGSILGSANGPWEANKSDQITFRGEAPGTGTLIDKDTLIIAANGVAMKLTRVQPDSAQVCTPELEICRLTYPITLHLGAAKKPMKEYSIYQPDMVALNWTVDPQIKKYSICEVKLLPAPGTKLQEVRLANARNIPAAQRSIPPFLFDSVAPGKYLLRLTAFCVGDVTVTSEVMLNVKSAVKTQAGVHDIQPNGDIQVISIVQAPNVHEEIITHSFIGSDFAHTEKMYDENGAEVEYCESHEGNIYRYQATLNKPIPKGETLFLGSKGWWEGVVNKVADNEYRYRMNHTPGGNVPIRRVEIFRLPKGAGLLETTPADLPHHMRNGQIEILVDTVIPIGGSLLTEFRYRHEGLQNVPDPEPMALYSKAKKLEVNVKSSSRKGRFICRSNVEESKELEGEYETPMTLVCTQKRLDITIVPVDGAPVSGELVINGNRRATWEGTDPERIRAGKTMEGVSVDLR